MQLNYSPAVARLMSPFGPIVTAGAHRHFDSYREVQVLAEARVVFLWQSVNSSYEASVVSVPNVGTNIRRMQVLRAPEPLGIRCGRPLVAPLDVLRRTPRFHSRKSILPSVIMPSNRVAARVDTIKKDLTPGEDKPMWPLSSYGPGKAEPTLIQGLDESPEEVRFMAWQALKSGDPTQVEAYKTYEQNKIVAAAAAHKNGQDHPEDAFQVAYRTAVSPPSTSEASTTAGTLTQPLATFGPPNSFGLSTPASVFGPSTQSVSAFGQSIKPTSAFGQTAFGQTTKPTSTFGQPSFGQPAQPASVSAFGQSAFGQPSKSSTAFGQPSFGQISQPSSVFGQSAFGQAPQPSAYGQPAFGQTSQPTSAFAQASQSTSVFGQPSQSTSVFGQPTKPTTFSQPSQPSAFGGGGGGSGAFGSASTTSNAIRGGFGAFANAGKPSTFGSSTMQSAFGAGGTGSAFGATPAPAPAPAPVTSAFGAGGTASAFNATSTAAAGSSSAFGPSAFASAPSSTPAVVAAPQAPSQPLDSAPPVLDLGSIPSSFDPAADPYAAKLPSNYMDMLPKEMREAFQSKEFQWGQVPEWTPPLEMR